MQPRFRPSLVAAVAAALAIAPSVGLAAALAPGDIAVLRAGDGSAAQGASGTGASLWVDEFTPTGTLVQSISVPATDVNALTISSTATTEGGMSLSLDSNYLVFAGYRRDAGLSGGNGQRSETTPRVIGRVDMLGNVDTSTIIRRDPTKDADLYSLNSVRDVASTDGTHFWVAGTNTVPAPPAATTLGSGLTYMNGLGPTSTGIRLDTVNSRGVGIFGGNLYANSQTTVRIQMITPGGVGTTTNGAVPTATPITNTTLVNGLANSRNSVFFDLDPNTPGIDTMYVGDGTSNTVLKYSLTSYNAADPTQNVWSPNGTVQGTATSGNGPFNLAGFQNPSGSVTLYYTNVAGAPTTTNNVLNTLTDASGFNAAPTGNFTTIATAATNTTFRGVAYITLAGDVTGDLRLDGDDYAVLDRFVAKNGLGAISARRLDGDLNADGKVDAGDYLAIDTAYAKTHGAPTPDFLASREARFGDAYVSSLLAAVPEPASLAACGLALPLLRRRRR